MPTTNRLRALNWAAFAAAVLVSAVALGEGPAHEEWDCAKVWAASDECGAGCSGIGKISCLLKCKNTHRERGTGLAREAFDSLTDCVKGHCPFKCSGGPTPGCKKCTAEECDAQGRKCLAQGKAPGSPDAGAALAAAAPVDAGAK
jgi:hypothetical protein